MTENGDIADAEKVPIMKNWSIREGPHLIITLTVEEQEMCKSSPELFQTLGEKFKPQHNETILLLQYCKLLRDSDRSVHEWIGHLRVKADKCIYP